MEKLNPDVKNLKKFGVTLGIAFLVIVFFVWVKRHYISSPISILAAIFLLPAFIYPKSLKWAYLIWMRLAFVLGWINTRILLLAIFYLLFTPIGIGIKLFGVDLLERKIDKNKDSYWKKKDSLAADYERQF